MLESIDFKWDSRGFKLVVFVAAISGLGGYWLGSQQSDEVIQGVSSNYADGSMVTPVSIGTVPGNSTIEQIQQNNQRATALGAIGAVAPPGGLLESEAENVEADFSIVYGSVNGTKYYNYGCKSGNRIKIENRLYFENEAEALLAGYEPSVNCDF